MKLNWNWQKIRPILIYGGISVLTLGVLGIAIYVATGHEIPFLSKRGGDDKETGGDTNRPVEEFTCTDLYGVPMEISIAVPEGATVIQKEEIPCVYEVSYQGVTMIITQNHGEVYPENIEEGYTAVKGDLVRTVPSFDEATNSYSVRYTNLQSEDLCVPNELFGDLRTPCAAGGPEFAPAGGVTVTFASMDDFNKYIETFDLIVVNTTGGFIDNPNEDDTLMLDDVLTLMVGYYGENNEYVDFSYCGQGVSYCDHFLLDSTLLSEFPLVDPYRADIGYFLSGTSEDAGVIAGNHYFTLGNDVEIAVMAIYEGPHFNGPDGYVTFNPTQQSGSSVWHIIVADSDQSKFPIFSDLELRDTVKISATASQVSDMGVATGHSYIRLLEGAVIEMYQKRPTGSLGWDTYCTESPQICFDYPDGLTVTETVVNQDVLDVTISIYHSQLIIRVVKGGPGGPGVGNLSEITHLTSNRTVGALWDYTLSRVSSDSFNGYVNYVSMCRDPSTCEPGSTELNCNCSSTSNAVVGSLFIMNLYVKDSGAAVMTPCYLTFTINQEATQSELNTYDQIMLSLRATE